VSDSTHARRRREARLADLEVHDVAPGALELPRAGEDRERASAPPASRYDARDTAIRSSRPSIVARSPAPFEPAYSTLVASVSPVT
jgi:hypothetical protein